MTAALEEQDRKDTSPAIASIRGTFLPDLDFRIFQTALYIEEMLDII
jgi:hypothetical protein